MIEVVPGIFTWPWFSERFGYDFHGTYLPAAKLVIDPVEPPAPVLARLVEGGVETVVLTNRNHFRAAAAVRAATSARVLVNDADAAFVRERGVTVDGALAPGDRVGPFTVLDAEGKSPGEVALWWPERRLLLVGDACVGHPAGALGLLPEKVMDDPPRLHASLRRLAELDVDTILVGDGVPILTGAQAALAALCARLP
jgi:glyoxylase-like metal-dependent hydrolase (beta-lactamase superfamily II)